MGPYPEAAGPEYVTPVRDFLTMFIKNLTINEFCGFCFNEFRTLDTDRSDTLRVYNDRLRENEISIARALKMINGQNYLLQEALIADFFFVLQTFVDDIVF